MLTPETVLQGRYRVIRQLGQGGMGAVYEAVDERLDTTVALKETLFADERLRKQFEREARLLARMHHPALPRVSDHFSESDGQFLIMQYISGDDLAQMMKDKQGPFPPDQVLTWGDQLLDALDYLHTQEPQIIHRDIKPQNLKLTPRGQIILLDFGLAKGETGGGVSIITTSASIFGYTPNYAPLEQIQGLGTDTRSDIYALSATLYHLMTGVKPPDALTRAASLVNGQPDPLRPANEISSSIGPQVAAVLARAMSQNREQRYPTAAGMRAALKGSEEVATLSGRAEAATVLFAPPDATGGMTATPTVRQTAVKAGETTVVHQSVSPSKRRMAPWAVGIASVVLIGAVFGVFYAYQRRNRSIEATPVNSVEVKEPAVPEPDATSTTEPTGGSVTEEKKNETVSQRAEIPAKKTEKASRGSEKSETAPTAAQVPPVTPMPGFEHSRFPENVNSTHPQINQAELLRLGRRGERLGMPQTKKLPDGTQVITNPDGSWVLVKPDGTTRVLRPRQRLLRKRPATNP